MAHLLVVDDDEVVRDLIGRIFTRLHYTITAVRDGQTALALLREQSFDVVLTDLVMEGADGLEVLDAAQKLPQPPAVIVLTGQGSLETAIAALRAGAYDYILKPFEIPHLRSCVAQAIERRRSEIQQREFIEQVTVQLTELQRSLGLVRPAQTGQVGGAGQQAERYLTIGKLTIDRFRHTARFQGEPLHFTRLEYALLTCLANAEGRVVGYGEILRHTHGYAADDTEAQMILKAHVHKLRRKIDPNYIISVRGIGYVLVAPKEEPNSH